MNIKLNGEIRHIPDNSTAQTLIDSLGLGDKRLAMELNQEIVPRSTFHDTHLNENDKIEIVHAIGGG